MADPIDRQAAIDELKKHRALYCDNTTDSFSKLSYAEKSRVDELDTAIAILVNQPSAQSEQECEKCIFRPFKQFQPERKKGKWILKPNICGVAYCSECGYELHTNNTNYCPNCGARMSDGE